MEDFKNLESKVKTIANNSAAESHIFLLGVPSWHILRLNKYLKISNS